MKDLAVLTPPFLMAAAVITAIVAFLRHEMGRQRADRADPEEEFPVSGAQADNTEDGESAGDTRAASTPARDAQL
jgi:hypothetical protein